MPNPGRFEAESIRKRMLAHKLHDSGHDCIEIGTQLGVSERSVHRFLNMTRPQIMEMRRNQAWREDAACRDADTDLFFPNAVGIKGANQKKQAMAICRTCPVIRQCKEAALANFENHGIWAGEDFSKYRYELDEMTGEILVSIQERGNGENAEVG